MVTWMDLGEGFYDDDNEEELGEAEESVNNPNIEDSESGAVENP